MAQNLQYFYAGYYVDSGLCHACLTTTYEINMEGWVEVPEFGDYVDKYYNHNGDQMWYWDAEFTQLWEECPSHNV